MSEDLLHIPEVVQLQGENLARLTDRVDHLAGVVANLTAAVQLQGENLARLTDRADQLHLGLGELRVRTDMIVSMMGTSMERSDQIMALLELHARTLEDHGAALARIEERLA